MREIKLRAWSEREMYYQPGKDEFTIYNIEKLFAKIKGDAVLMLFIGLKDKNGVDIYEGDICEVANNENANHLQTVNCNYAKRLIKGDLLIIKCLLSGFTGQILSNQGEQPNLIGNVCNYSLWNGARQLVIIGNIHQNPELLLKS